MESGVALGVDDSRPVIEFPANSPHDSDLTELVQGIALDTINHDVPEMKIFFYVDDELAIFETDPLIPREDQRIFSEWFPDYYAGHRTLWEESHVVVYSDTIEGRDEVRYHVVIGEDLPVYALCINRKTGQSAWYLQETTTARDLAARK